MTAAEYKEELIRDSFILVYELTSSLIRQRLLENRILTLQEAFDKASAVDLAQRNSQLYCSDNSFHASGSLSAIESCDGRWNVMILLLLQLQLQLYQGNPLNRFCDQKQNRATFVEICYIQGTRVRLVT